ncbi:MAG: beta-galactosidase [Oscillospiraceae bacterium]|nr:beta-galactosidase [Oscillospiraceae bacterium]
MPILSYDKDNFLMDGKPYQIISGAIHYFRVPCEYWEDRLKKLKACGFNTVETYTPWNLHERREGEFDFGGMLDIERFITIAESLDLNVIVRPGPYICAEWELGGLPSWLLKYDIGLRCSDPAYLEKVAPYYRELLSRIRPHLSTNGGRVIMVQVENEYGSYGDDKEYLKKVVEMYRENGIDCLLFTSDGPSHSMCFGGISPELLSVANFGSNVKQVAEYTKKLRPNQPFMCGEFWCGWFDHWHDKHHTRSAEEFVKEIQSFFDVGGSFNVYMLHGGTNFGFTNGANHHGKYEPTITSYDYCAPISECGDLTDTYFALKDCIEKNTGKKAPDLEVCNLPKAAYGQLELSECAPLFENLENISKRVFAAYPQTMEQLNQDFGYIVYSTEIEGPFEELSLNFTHLHDRAHIFVNGELVGIRERSYRNDEVKISVDFNEKKRLDILVENMGRINYCPKLFDKKGIVGGIKIGNRFHFGFSHYCLPMEDLSSLKFKKAETSKMPTFYKGSLKIEGEPCDTFVKLQGFEKGFVIVNGHNLGRYYNSAGPQKTLYLPSPFLKSGENEVIVFESDECKAPVVEFVDKPELS